MPQVLARLLAKNSNHNSCRFENTGAGSLTAACGRTEPVDSDRPEDLWDYLADYEEKTGGRAIAVPHNGNLSNGLMFGEVDSDGQKITREYAQKRIRWETLHEMTQIKGDEETHPLLSPEDEFADF